MTYGHSFELFGDGKLRLYPERSNCVQDWPALATQDGNIHVVVFHQRQSLVTRLALPVDSRLAASTWHRLGAQHLERLEENLGLLEVDRC